MTKRILAIVMVLVLSLSMFAVEAFADTTNMDITASASGTSISVSWSAVPNATTYDVELYQNGSRVNSQSGVKTTSVTLSTNNKYGDFSVNVTARNSDGGIVGSGSKAVNVPYSSTYNGISVSSDGASSVKVSWTSKSYINTYYVSWSGKSTGNTTASNSGTTCSVTINVAYSDLSSITVREGNSSGSVVGTWYPTSSGSQQGPSAGGVSLNTTTGVLSWNSYYGYSVYNIYYAVANGTEQFAGTSYATSTSVSSILRQYSYTNITFIVYASTSTASKGTLIGYTTYNGYYSGGNTGTGGVSLNGYTLSWPAGSSSYTVYVNGQYWTRTYNTSIDVQSIISSYYNASVTFSVYNANNALIGSATYNGYYGGSSGSSYNGFNVYVSNGAINISWNSISGVPGYIVSYAVNGGTPKIETTTSTGYSIAYAANQTVSIEVYARANFGGFGSLIGTATVVNGYVNYTSNSYNGGSSTTSGSIQGNNCYIVVGSTSSTLYWNNLGNYSNQNVVYFYNGKIYSLSAGSSNSITIPLGSGATFDVAVYVYGNSNPIATVTVTGSYSGSGSSSNNGGYTKSEYVGLTLTEVSSGTQVSWDSVSGCDYYIVDYGAITGSGFTEGTMKTSFTIPFFKRGAFSVRVYAHFPNGTGRNVGHAIHLAGDPYTSTSSDKTDSTTTPTVPEYVTGFKATSGNKKVTLSWNAVNGNPKYEIYWKRSSASQWKKAGEIEKRAVNITGLVNGTSYDFMIRANGKDSGIITIAPQSSGSTTKTAKDPAGAGTTTASTPEITSAESTGSGSIKLTWNAVKNASAYQIWIAENGSSTYAPATNTKYFPNAKVTISGTTATITGLSAGTYKIRIKANTDGNWYQLSDSKCVKSEYRTVTVK